MNRSLGTIGIAAPEKGRGSEPGGAVFSIENQKDGSLLVWVPGGPFLAGENPIFEISVPGFYISQACVTNSQYGLFVRETGYRSPELSNFGSPVWRNGRYPEDMSEHPVVCVDWNDAQAYCRWADLRLPGELEWEKASRGVDGRQFPWGNQWHSEKCRHFNNKGTGTTECVWAFPAGASDFGCFQMSGNVWEWCQDSYAADTFDRYRRGDPTPPEDTGRRVARGGSWLNHDVAGYFHCASRYHGMHGYRDACFGFRVAKDHVPQLSPQP